MTEIWLAEIEILKAKLQERDGMIYELEREVEMLKKKLEKAETNLSYMQNSMCGNMEMGK